MNVHYESIDDLIEKLGLVEESRKGGLHGEIWQCAVCPAHGTYRVVVPGLSTVMRGIWLCPGHYVDLDRKLREAKEKELKQ
jgi:hypothetical protein